MWAWIILYVAMTLISALLTPKPKVVNAKPGTIGDKDMPIASQSSPIPVVFGTVWLTQPNVVWWGNLFVTAIRRKTSGKK
ncbi:MAG: hypothetical protein LBW85_08550 [Deltaproteobacteria bacterium]|jgi:hypothetical protein|nr:hypothetical protein [Deltaproteobacteria bacterium]